MNNYTKHTQSLPPFFLKILELDYIHMDNLTCQFLSIYMKKHSVVGSYLIPLIMYLITSNFYNFLYYGLEYFIR